MKEVYLSGVAGENKIFCPVCGTLVYDDTWTELPTAQHNCPHLLFRGCQFGFDYVRPDIADTTGENINPQLLEKTNEGEIPTDADPQAALAQIPNAFYLRLGNDLPPMMCGACIEVLAGFSPVEQYTIVEDGVQAKGCMMPESDEDRLDDEDENNKNN